MTFKEWADSRYGNTDAFSRGMIEEYANYKAEQSARRAAEYAINNYLSMFSKRNLMQDLINEAIQHAISEG